MNNKLESIVLKNFGPSVLKVRMPQNIIDNINQYIDEIVIDKGLSCLCLVRVSAQEGHLILCVPKSNVFDIDNNSVSILLFRFIFFPYCIYTNW